MTKRSRSKPKLPNPPARTTGGPSGAGSARPSAGVAARKPGPTTPVPGSKAAALAAAAGAGRISTDPKVYAGLKRFNLIMGAVHLLQGILMIVISNAKAYPITTDFFRFDAATTSLVNNPQTWINVRFGPAVALFLLISAIAHFSLATFGNKWYVANLKKGMNPARFYEYALSSSLMIVLIGMLVGITNLGAIIAIFGVNAMMNLFGIMMELHNQTTPRTDWTSFIYGCIAGIVPWIVILIWFFSAVSTSPSQVPWFVYTIIPTIFVFFSCFAVNMYLQYKKIGKWKDYLYGERAYIVLSLVAKTTLAWLIFSGTMAP
jgi:hypothetical protein